MDADVIFPPGVVVQMRTVKRLALEHALGVTGGNRTHAARLLGVSVDGVQKSIKRLRIRGRFPVPRGRVSVPERACPKCGKAIIRVRDGARSGRTGLRALVDRCWCSPLFRPDPDPKTKGRSR